MGQVLIADQLAEIMTICRDAPTVVLSGAYLRAARQFCNKTRWLLRPSNITTVAGTVVYTLPPPDAFTEVHGIQAAQLIEASGRINVLTEGFSGEWDPNEASGADAMPDSYQYVPEGNVALYRTAAEAWNVKLTVAVQPLRNAVSIDSSLVVSWDYALQAGALAWLLMLPRTPWLDKNEALRQDALFRGYCNQAHMSAQRGFNAGAEHGDRPGSSSGMLRTRVLSI